MLRALASRTELSTMYTLSPVAVSTPHPRRLRVTVSLSGTEVTVLDSLETFGTGFVLLVAGSEEDVAHASVLVGPLFGNERCLHPRSPQRPSLTSAFYLTDDHHVGCAPCVSWLGSLPP